MKQVVTLILVLLLVTPDLGSGLPFFSSPKTSYSTKILSAIRGALQRNFGGSYTTPHLLHKSSDSGLQGKTNRRLWVMCLSFLCVATDSNIFPKNFYKNLDYLPEFARKSD